jgi:hypothetical protein
METLVELRRKAKELDNSYHTDLGRILAVEASQGEGIPGIEAEFKARRKQYTILARKILQLEKELQVEPDYEVEPDSSSFLNPFR